MKTFLHEQNFTHVGFIRKAYGYKGEMRLAIDDVYEEDILESQFIFIELDGLKVPFKIESFNTSKDLIVKFERVDDADGSEVLIGKQLFLLEKEIIHAQKYIDEEKEIDKFVGYQINDKTSGRCLEIFSIQEFPQQIMAVVMIEEKEVLIPLNDQFIIEINEKEKILAMELPEGLLDLLL